jgi:MSHA biogenesis protein MshQ
MIDEAKLYSFELSPSEVVADMTLGRSCSGAFDHLRIEHDGIASVCAPERVTLKACLDSGCTTLYPGSVTVNLSPPGWIDGDTFTFTGGIGTRQLSRSISGNVTLASNSVSPTPASATRCFKGSTETCTMNFASASCAFDAVEPGANPQSPIYTKLSGTPFDIDVLALLTPTTINPGYTGNVAIDLVDATGSVCPSGAGLNLATNISFVSGDAGRKSVSFNYPEAARDVRIRATVGSSAPACSSDNFAIRPQTFVVTSNDATNTDTTGTPVIKAGADFNLTATAITGYDGIPQVDTSALTGTPVAGILSGSFTSASAASGSATGTSFRYTEVGLFGLAQNAIYDASFTAVDQPDDCLSGYSNLLSGGKFGCSIGSLGVPLAIGSSGFGRFIPARFNLNSNAPLYNPACNSGFTYLGQPFSYLIEPELTFTALNSSGDITRNYGGSYWKMSSALTGRTYTDNVVTAATLMPAAVGTVSWAGTADSDGIGTVKINSEQLVYTKPATPEAAFSTNLNLNFSIADLTDDDGVCYDPENDAACNGMAINGIFGTEQRYGRMQFQNGYGPEVLDVTIPLVVEYFDGNGFVVNTIDSCTGYVSTSPELLLSNYQNGLADGETLPTGGGTLAFGLGSLNLSAPGVGNDGSVDLTYDLDAAGLSWLKWDGSNPVGKATFGIFKGNERLIYIRESIR